MCPISGGNWNNAASAGVWALNCNNVRGNSNNNVGFRADSGPQTGKPDGGTKGGAFRQSLTAKSVCHLFSGRSATSRLERLAVNQ